MAYRLNRLRIIAVLVALLLCCGTAHAEPISVIITAFATAGIVGGLSATAGVLLGLATSLALTAAIGFGISALSGKPKSGGTGGWAERTQALQTISRSAIETRKIVFGQVRTSGSLALLETTGGGKAWLYMMLLLASHKCESIDEVYLDEKPATPTLLSRTLNGVDYWWTTRTAFKATGKDGHTKNNELARFSFRMGDDDQVAEPFLLTPIYQSPNARALESIGWTENDRLQGICYLFCELLFSEDRFRGGSPNITVDMHGAADVYDPRDGQQKYTDNWALCVRYYLKKIGVPDSAINDDSVIASANISDELVDLKDGGTQKRYTINGVIDLGQQQKDVLEQLAVCGSGAIIYSQGQYHIFAGAFDAPSHTVDEDWLAGPVEVTPRPPRSELFNTVKGVYTDGKGATWQPVDFPHVSSTEYVVQDGGITVYKDIELPFVTEPERAQRIARSILERHRSYESLTLLMNWRGLNIRAWDTISLTLPELGITSQTYRVLEWSFDVSSGVKISVRKESASVYNWDENDAQDTNNGGATDDDRELPPPTALTVAERLYVSTDGSGVKVAADLTWGHSGITSATTTDDGGNFIASPFATGYVVGWKLSTDADYVNLLPVTSNSATLQDFTPGIYDFQVYAVDANNVASEAISRRREIFGLTAKPTDISGLSMIAISNQAHLKWTLQPDIDVQVGGSIRVKHTPLLTGGSWETAAQLVDDIAGSSTQAVVPLLDGTYLLKAVDSTGNESETPASVITNIVNLLNLNVIEDSDQHSDWLGTKTNMVRDFDNGWLKLESADLWDDISGNIDDWLGLIDSGSTDGVAVTGEYLFYNATTATNYYDGGAVYNSRITISGEAVIDTVSDTWDSLYPSINIDSWPGLIDGEGITGTFITYFVRTTDDDPSGTPVWSNWQQFVIGDYTARAYQFKAVVTNAFPSQNIFLKTLNVKIDFPDREERFPDSEIDAAGTLITYAKPFISKPWIGTVIEDAHFNDTALITHATSGGRYTGVTVQVVHNNSGTGEDAIVDVYAKGY